MPALSSQALRLLEFLSARADADYRPEHLHEIWAEAFGLQPPGDSREIRLRASACANALKALRRAGLLEYSKTMPAGGLKFVKTSWYVFRKGPKYGLS